MPDRRIYETSHRRIRNKYCPSNYWSSCIERVLSAASSNVRWKIEKYHFGRYWDTDNDVYHTNGI